MGNPRIFRICLGLACLLIPILYGQIKVDIGSSSDKDLKRTAHQLRISVEQLKNAREALQEATDFAARSMDASSLAQLGQSWVRIDRNKAQAAIEALYAQLRTNAQGASDVMTYQRCISAAQMLLSALTPLDSGRVIDLWRQWPDPPAALGASAERLRDQVQSQFPNIIFMNMIASDPEQALALLKEQGAKPTDAATISRLATQLNQIGRKDEALSLVDQTIADFKQSTPDARTIQNYLSFVRALPNVDSGRYLQAVNALLSQANQQTGANAGGTLTVGGQSVQLTTPEAVLVDLCRGLSGHLDLTMKTLDMIPSLKSKIDGLGGFDNVVRTTGSTTMRLDYALGNMRMSVNSGGGVSMSSLSTSGARGAPTPSVGPSSTSINPSQTASQLYPSLRGKARKNPSFVSEKLSELAKDPSQIDVLTNLASRANIDDPDLASMALEAAARVVMQVEPLQKRTSTLQNLMRTYRMCEGEVSADLVRMGFNLVQQLREEEKSRAANYPLPLGVLSRPIGTSNADRLEASLIADLALENFEGTMRYVRSMPEEQRLLTLVQIVQNLSQSY